MWLALAHVWALLVACSAASNDVLERLDERAGVVLTRAREPLVFARTEPRYSRSSRDYLYLGPVETNRQGVREYFLWVGVATTLDRGFIAPTAELPSTLYVTVEGEPIELSLEPWRELVRTQILDAPYVTAVPLRGEFAARVTLQQLTLIASTHVATVAVESGAANAVREYPRWESRATFDDFLEIVRAR